MSASKKIVLPIVTKDVNGNDFTKEVHYDCDLLKTKNVRDWEEKGKVVDNKCVMFSSLKITAGKLLEGESLNTSDFVVIAMSRKKLVEKLEAAGLISVVPA